MSWNPALAELVELPDVDGYHLNVAPEAMTPAAEAFRVDPSSPARVFAGDVGVPRTVPVFDEETGEATGSAPNADWNADAPTFSTVFCHFADEAEARDALPELWLEDVEDSDQAATQEGDL